MKNRIRNYGFMVFIPIAVLALCAGRTEAAQVVWTGDGDGANWFDQANWDVEQVPGDDAEVVIADGTILLTNETHALLSYTMTGGTLVFTNWNTRLRADTVVIGDGATLTLPGPFTEAGPSNRVWIVCTDFTIEEGGVIDADGKGYDSNQGPGAGGGGRRAGGGYGGRGGVSHWWRDSVEDGQTYGTPDGLPQPGSGGCEGDLGGAGGGVVQIEASGEIAIHGLITSDGDQGQPRRYTPPGGGSGGGIHLSCHTFSGSETGEIRARGGDGAVEKVSSDGGRGGGGRIVIQYVSASPWPAVAIDAAPGEIGYEPSELSGDSYIGDWGTLWLSDASVLDTMTETLDENTFPLNNITLYIDGFNEWTVDNLSVSNRAFRFGDTNFALNVNAKLQIGANGRLDVARVKAGSVLVTNGGRLDIRSAPSDGISEWGGELDVEGDLHIAADSRLRLVSAWYGGLPRVHVHNLILDHDGRIDAQGTGLFAAHGDGAGSISSRRRGGGYGGEGGTGDYSDPGGQPYGTPVGPMFAGSGGCFLPRGGHGGGLIHIEAVGEIRLNGIIDADGGNGGYHRDHGAGGGSGGGVFLLAQRVTGSGTGLISVRGGFARGQNAGGGGGGRIAIWTGISGRTAPLLLDMLQAGHMPAGTVVESESLPNGLAGDFTEVIHLDGGDPSSDSATAGEPGTFRWIAVRQGTLFMVR